MSRLQSSLTRFEEWIAITFLALMCMATFANVVARYAFNAPIQWAEEFSRYAFIWLVFISAVVATNQKKHIIIDTVVAYLPLRAQAVCRVVVDLLVLILTGIMVYYGVVMMTAATQPTATLRIPQYYIYLAVPFSGLLIFYHTLVELAGLVRSLRAGGEAA